MKAPLYVGGGVFGHHVVDDLARRGPCERADIVMDRRRLDDLVAGRPFVGMALWRTYEADCHAVDRLCFTKNIPWSLSLLEGSALYSVLFVPGRGACYACFRRRFLTHQANPERSLALYHAYAGNPDLGPSGFVQPAVTLAANTMWDAFGSAAYENSTLFKVDLLTLECLSSLVVPIHGCDRCGAHDPEVQGGLRFTTRASREWQTIMNGRVHEG